MIAKRCEQGPWTVCAGSDEYSTPKFMLISLLIMIATAMMSPLRKIK